MALHRRGGIYHYHFWVDGTRYRGSTKKANLARPGEWNRCCLPKPKRKEM